MTLNEYTTNNQELDDRVDEVIDKAGEMPPRKGLELIGRFFLDESNRVTK